MSTNEANAGCFEIIGTRAIGEHYERAMKFIDLTLPTLTQNLALDEALLLAGEAETNGEILRLWEWPSLAVVLGTGCRLADDVNEAACVADNVPILRRASGGGTVLLGPGCLCFSLVLAYHRARELQGVRSSYAYILTRIRDCLSTVTKDIEVAGISDLAIGTRKFSGNSQQRKRSYLLHHGTILYALEFERVGRYLKMPVRQPEYRQSRDHSMFLTNLAVDVETLRSCLRDAWRADRASASWPENLVNSLVHEKYTSAWIRKL